MNGEIETLDKRRMRNLEWFLIGSVTIILLSVTRYFFRLGELNSEPIGSFVLAGLLVSLLVLIRCTVESYRIGRRLREEPSLKEALDNELLQAIEVQSWKAAFMGAVGATIFFAITWFFYPVCDPVMVALTSIVMGAACYQANVYFTYKFL